MRDRRANRRTLPRSLAPMFHLRQVKPDGRVGWAARRRTLWEDNKNIVRELTRFWVVGHKMLAYVLLLGMKCGVFMMDKHVLSVVEWLWKMKRGEGTG